MEKKVKCNKIILYVFKNFKNKLQTRVRTKKRTNSPLTSSGISLFIRAKLLKLQYVTSKQVPLSQLLMNIRVLRDFLFASSIALIFLGILLFFFGLGVVAIYVCLIGAVGILGTKTNNDCAVISLLMGSFFMMVIFISLWYELYSVQQLYLETNKGNPRMCVNHPKFRYANLVNNEARNLLCSQKCQCYVHYQWEYTDEQLKKMDYSTIRGALNVQQCPNYSQMNDQLKIPRDDFYEAITFNTNFESIYDCAGICQPYHMFLFTDTSRGAPKNKQGCFLTIMQYAAQVTSTFVILCLIMAIFTLCIFIASLLYLLYKPDQEYHYVDL